MDTSRQYYQRGVLNQPGPSANEFGANSKWFEASMKAAMSTAPASGNAVQSLAELRTHSSLLTSIQQSQRHTGLMWNPGNTSGYLRFPAGRNNIIIERVLVTSAGNVTLCLWNAASSSDHPVGFKFGDLTADPNEPWFADSNVPAEMSPVRFSFVSGETKALDVGFPISTIDISALWDPMTETWSHPASQAASLAYNWSQSYENYVPVTEFVCPSILVNYSYTTNIV
jgi:hypothetical protein